MKINNPLLAVKEDQVLKEKLPLVILVDQGTARAAEVMAGALQAQYGALLMGYKTFGDCAVSKVFPLKDGSALIVSVGYCYTPKDQLIQGKVWNPISPDLKKMRMTNPWVNPASNWRSPKKFLI